MAMLKRLERLGCGVLLGLLASTAVAEVVVVVSAENPVPSLTSAQLADIYLGRATHLPSGEAVEPIDQSERSPAHDEFYREYLGRTAAQVKAHWSRLIFTGRGQPPRSVAGNEAMVEAVTSTPRAIGYIDSEYLEESLQVINIE